MKFLTAPLAALVLSGLAASSVAAEDAGACYELRTYYAAEGKLEALHQRFRDHTLGFFAKHGMTNLHYWVPEPNEDARLIFLLRYSDREAREAAWAALIADPEWQAAKAESERDGPLVAKAESLFLHRTDYSPDDIEPADGEPRLYEMRVYTTLPGRLDAIDARFRDHTMGLFSRHGMVNLPYFHLDEGQEGADTTLLYFLAHGSKEARDASFGAFRSDPEWIAARDASEAEGKILIENGVASTLLLATDYSPAK